MNKTVLSSMVLGGLLSYGVQGSPLLYTDYLTALEAPVSDALQQYVLGGGGHRARDEHFIKAG